MAFNEWVLDDEKFFKELWKLAKKRMNFEELGKSKVEYSDGGGKSFITRFNMRVSHEDFPGIIKEYSLKVEFMVEDIRK